MAIFRGTDEVRSWLYNLKLFAIKYPDCENCWVHKGWHDAYKGIVPGIVMDLGELFKMYSEADLLVVGHSLGGVLATYASLDIL